MRTVLAFLLLLFLASPVQAIPIEGTILGAVLTDFIPGFNLRGPGFSLTGVDVSAGDSFPFAVTGVKFLNTPVDLSHTVQIRQRLTVGTGGSPPTLQMVTGSLTFDVEPFQLTALPETPGLPRFATGKSSFTMAGAITFSGQTVGLEGFGSMEYRGVLLGPVGREFMPTLITFEAVPEPATLTLLGSLGALAGLYRWRRGRRVSRDRG